MRAVLPDFYGTLGESEWSDWWMDTVLAEYGHRLDPETAARWSANAWDGEEHHEHSTSAEAYEAWERQRWHAMLAEHGIEGEGGEVLLDRLTARRREFRMQLYPEAMEVLAELRGRGLRLAVCSNWDWDLDYHLEYTGVADAVDVRVSSAWVGARKPHPRIFESTLAELGVDADDALFVGDNWEADVEGPLAAGLRAVHVWRHDTHPGDWLPRPPDPPPGVARIDDLQALPDLL